MTVAELRDILLSFDGDAEVLLKLDYSVTDVENRRVFTKDETGISFEEMVILT